MHVLLLGKIPPIQGGVSRSTWLAAGDFLKAGHSIDVISNANSMEYGFRQMMMEDDEEIEDFCRHGGAIHNVEKVPSHSYIPWSTPFLSQMLGAGFACIKRAMPDVIIGWYFEPYGVAASILGKMHNVPVILRHAGSDLGRLHNIPTLGTAYDGFMTEAAGVISGKSSETENILKQAGVRYDAIFKPKGRALHKSFFDTASDCDLAALVATSEAAPFFCHLWHRGVCLRLSGHALQWRFLKIGFRLPFTLRKSRMK